MRVFLSLVVVVMGTVGAALASPVDARLPSVARQGPGPGPGVASVGRCPMDCWNEAAGLVDCDPNVDDECLCGTFFDEVAACTGTTCGIAENLATLDFMEQACN